MGGEPGAFAVVTFPEGPYPIRKCRPAGRRRDDRAMNQKHAKAFGRGLLERVREDDVTGMATELAYRFLFAIFPFGIFLAALGAFVAAAMGISNPGQQI